jgi:hypothetical protein
MKVTVSFSPEIIRYPCSFEVLMEHKVKEAIRWDDTMKVTASFIDLYKCASCKPVYRVPFIDYPEIALLKAMKEGTEPIAAVSFDIFIPQSIY